jgi:hypothetical protein
MAIAWSRFALAWLAVAVGALAVRAVGILVAGHTPTLASATTDLTLIAMWAVASPFVFRSAKRFPTTLAKPLPNGAIHLLLGTSFIVASNLAIRLPMLWRIGLRGMVADMGMGIATYYPGAIVIYLVLVAIGQRLAVNDSRAADTLGNEVSVAAADTGEVVNMPSTDRLVIRQWNRVHLIALDDIEWIEAANNHVVVHTGTREYKGRERMSDVEARLDERRFVRVHRSAIVHVDKIREVQPLARGDHSVILQSGQVVRVARTRRQFLESGLGMPLR